MTSLEITREAIRSLDRKKGSDIKAVRVEDITVLADYFVFATGDSSTQVKALADETEYRLSQLGVEPNHIEQGSNTWVLMDYGSVIINIFYRETRDFYKLEHLWADGESLDISDILNSEGDNGGKV